jgi:hypothetical protein
MIVPAWNRVGPLSACLPSLLDLDCPHVEFEVIVVDDGSEPPLDTGRRPDPSRQASTGSFCSPRSQISETPGRCCRPR